MCGLKYSISIYIDISIFLIRKSFFETFIYTEWTRERGEF